jgi:hypothetical protein
VFKDNPLALALAAPATLRDAGMLRVVWVIARVHIAVLALGAARTGFPKADIRAHGNRFLVLVRAARPEAVNVDAAAGADL